MNDILTEKQYQHEIIDYLQFHNGYRIRPASAYDRPSATDPEMLFEFLNTTQPDTMASLQKIYKDDLKKTLMNVINQAVTSGKSSLIEVLKYGVEISSKHLDLMYTKPATTFNSTLNRLYDCNILSVMEEVWASDDERIDLVIFLNGLAVMSFELKCNYSGQTYQDAICQYRTSRNPKTRLFRFKAGTVVNFAMDMNEVYMTTRLDGPGTVFLPFNMGTGSGVDSGAGNPVFPDRYSVSYMWEDILTKDTVIDLISKFIFLERSETVDESTGKKKRSESLIFPRYHQLDLIRKLLASVSEHGTELNYLVQHSAGSGKTNSIAWLTYRLASLHDADNHAVFDSVVIVTDRVVVDRQLQKAVLGLDHKEGMIRVMDDKCSSADLADVLKRGTKIIATTIQKFPHIADAVENLKDRRFAVIIDEAHSSTAGKEMQAVTHALGSGSTEYRDADDLINDRIEKSGKPANVSMFAFTATPKPKTLRLFGRMNPNGQYEAFHLYSMKQAIEEGYILDVLQNFTEYKTMCRLNKEIENDPKMEKNEAKKQITRFIQLHDTNIAQRIEIIVEHFRNVVMEELGGMAKAMVVTPSRQAAVKYRQAFEDYINRHGYKGISALVAFSGKVKLDEDEKEYTEVGMNGIREEQLPAVFDGDEYNVLIVADKYQTGFDQKKLCAMYVLKKLHGVNAVQTFSRLNRICPPYDKKTFILDFVNSYEEIQKAFAPYYTTTILSGNMNPSRIYDLEAELDAYMFMDPEDIENFADILFAKKTGNITAAQEKKLRYCLSKAEKAVKGYKEEQQTEIRIKIRGFIKFYEFLTLASCFSDANLHKKYIFLTYLIPMLSISTAGSGFDLKGKIRADGFVQEKKKEHKDETLVSSPVMELPTTDDVNVSPEMSERLSRIIEEINSQMGQNYDRDVVTKSMLQIRDKLLKSEKLKLAAKNNDEEYFELAFYPSIDDVLIKVLDENKDFFSLLLNNDELKKSVLGFFVHDIYSELKQAD